MKEQLPNDSNSSPETANRINAVQNRILNNILIVLLVSSVLGISISISATVQNGFKYIHIFQIIHFIISTGAVIFRNRLSYNIRYGILIGILFLLSILGISNYGLIGNGVMFLIVASVLASVLASKFHSIIVFGISIAIIIFFMHLFITGHLVLSIDMNSYQRMSKPWIGILIIFFMFIGMLISVTSSLFKNMRELILESTSRMNDIEQLNETLEDKVRKRTEELTLLNNDKDRILGIVAHDINNKLGGIIGYLEMLKENAKKISEPEFKQYTERALEASILASAIVSDLTEFSKQKSDSQILPTETVDIISFIQSTIDCHTPKALEKTIEIKITASDERIYCNINRAKFSRVLDNLISNAIKFTHNEGSINIGITKTGNGRILISIADSGIGIPSSIRDNIYKPFSLSGRPGTANEKSTGLGLSITKEIVESHSGKIWFESKEDKGTTFFILLPGLKVSSNN